MDSGSGKFAKIVPTIALFFSLPLVAQTPVNPAFEVATVRPSARDARGGGRTITDRRVDIRNTALFQVLLDAFQTDEYRFAGPGWLKTTRFDIQATIPAGTSRSQVPEMLQRLLRERLGLVAHVETRPVSVYELVVGAGGIKLREVEPVDDLERTFPSNGGVAPVDTIEGEGAKRQRTILTTDGLKVVTARALWDQRLTSRRTWQVDATRMGIEELVMLLGGIVDRPVLDKTTLTGVYQFKVELPGLALRLIPAPTARDGAPRVEDPSGVSVFRAVESLGLKLESRRSPLSVVVVDKIERNPTPN